jgi:hypothetical protein
MPGSSNSEPTIPLSLLPTAPLLSTKETIEKIQKDIIKATLKFGAFGTQYKSESEFINELKMNNTLQMDVLDVLYRRGLTKSNDNIEFINNLVVPLLEKNQTHKQGDLYVAMRERINSTNDSRIDEVLEYIRDHLAPKKDEKEKYGEVFTPLPLVDEMLSKLPDDVWTNPDLKWLDPANGIGNFPIKAFIGQTEGIYKDDGPYNGIKHFTYPGLMNGLEKAIPNLLERCKHIIEKMLYMIDINGKNNAIARRLFQKLCPNTNPNIEKIDSKQGFLTNKALIFNGKTIDNFDIILGNPPFNSGGINRPDTRKNKIVAETNLTDTKKETIWNKFVIQSYKYLKPNGHLLFIHPIGWFHDGEYNNVRDILLTNQINVIKIYKNTQAVILFSGSGKISVAYYHMEKIPITKNTTIIGTSGTTERIRLDNTTLIMLNNTSIINKCMDKLPFWQKNKQYKHTSVKCVPGSNKQIKGIYVQTKKDKTNFDIQFVKTMDKHVDQNIPKVFISAYGPYYDKTGEYGSVGASYWIGNKSNLDKLYKFMNTKLAVLLTRELKYRSGDFVEYKYFPDVTNIDLEDITDKTLSDYFGFTKDENTIIDSIDLPKREYTFKEITCNESKQEKSAEGGSRYTHKTRKLRRR